MTNQELDSLQVGSVVRRKGSDSYRVCRLVSRWSARRGPYTGVLRVMSVTFTIRHRSWTNRPYTVYDRAALKQLEYVGTGAKVTLRTKLDRRIANAITHTDDRSLTARHVRGIN